MRPWDSFFWWVECGAFPERLMVHPAQWVESSPRPALVSGKLLSENRLLVRSPSDQVTVWLSPEWVNFEQPLRVTIGRKTLREPAGGIEPDAETLLEDVRTRSDRQHPFWARIDWP